MTRLFRVGLAATIGLAMAAPAGFAQQPAATKPAPDPASSPVVTETRPATTTFQGDTGLWFVPLGEVLPEGRWSGSVYYTNFDRQEGFTDISSVPVTFGYGIGNRAELFAAISAVTRIDRDIRPIFIPGNEAGGPVNDYPRVRQGWSGTTFGDILVGGKVNFLSQADQAPVAMALRAMAKLPTGSTDKGTSSGQADFFVDYIVSKEVNQRADVSGYVGAAFRADAEQSDQSNGLRYGFGVGVPSRGGLQVHRRAVRREVLRGHDQRRRADRVRRQPERRRVLAAQPARRRTWTDLHQLQGLLRRRRTRVQLQRTIRATNSGRSSRSQPTT